MTRESEEAMRRRNRADEAARRSMINTMLLQARPDLGREERRRAIAEMLKSP